MAKLLPTTVIIAAFNDEDAADTISAGLAKAALDKQIPQFLNLAIARKDESAKVKVSEMGNGLGFASGTIGALVGGLSCILLGVSFSGRATRHSAFIRHDVAWVAMTMMPFHAQSFR